MPPAVFLDRDDTLIANREVTAGTDHVGDLFDPALVRLLPGAAGACRRLRDAGFLLVVVSNQGAVARGRCSLDDVARCNERLRYLARTEAGVEFDAVYVCPYHPKGTVPPYNIEHSWRKPGPGMLLQAASDLRIDLARSWMVGDAPRDVQAGIAAGIAPERSLLVGPESDRFPSVVEAAEFILRATIPG